MPLSLVFLQSPLYDECSIFIMTVISFFPHGTTQTEGEDNREQLNGNDNDDGSNDNVEIFLNQHDQLVVTTGVHVRVIQGGSSDAVLVLRQNESSVGEEAAGLRNLKMNVK